MKSAYQSYVVVFLREIFIADKVDLLFLIFFHSTRFNVDPFRHSWLKLYICVRVYPRDFPERTHFPTSTKCVREPLVYSNT